MNFEICNMFSIKSIIIKYDSNFIVIFDAVSHMENESY